MSKLDVKLDDYEIYGETTSLCEECLSLVPAKIILRDNSIYYLKSCPEHSLQNTLISTDFDYFRRAKEDIFRYRPKENFGRPAMGIIEVLDECNMECPICIGTFSPGSGKIKPLKKIKEMLGALLDKHPDIDILMISGGEPTIHPNIIDILDYAFTRFKHIMLISNGVRIAEDVNFVTELSKYRNKLEVYLQFDSIKSVVTNCLRGENLSEVRINSVRNLEKEQIHSTLICVVAKNLNEFEMNEIIDFGLSYKFIRGVTFQPLKSSGRNKKSFSKENDYITLSEVRQNILITSKYFKSTDLIPHPLNPENISIGYLIKEDNNKIETVTEYLFASKKTTGEEIPENFQNSSKLLQKMYFIPEINTEKVKYENLFRVTIVSILDKYNFCISSLDNACIYFITTENKIVPLDTYYLFNSKE